MKLKEEVYLIEIVKGLCVTVKHLVKSIFFIEKCSTAEYPEEKKVMPERYRGRHRLTLREDGSPRCVACFMCATACPADCIYIEAGEHADKRVEKYPVRFEIDILRCVFCGFCVEACPVDAIRMDTGKFELADTTRKALIYKKEYLLKDSVASKVK